MTEHLPALTKPEMARLREISKGQFDPDSVDLSPNHKRNSTAELINLKLVVVRGREVAVTGRVMKAGICDVTHLGRRWIATHGA